MPETTQETSLRSARRRQSAPASPQPALLSAAQAARDLYDVSERTFHAMRARGLVPAPIVLGPRLLRWHRAELEAAISGMPRLTAPQKPPAHLNGGTPTSQPAAA